MQCPNDQSSLTRHKHVYSCETCHGSFHKREGLEGELYTNLGQMFRKQSVAQNKTCPHCQSDMMEVKHREGALYLDICQSCLGVWFDAGEIEHLERYVERRLRRSQKYVNQAAQSREDYVQKLYKRYQEAPPDYENPTLREALFQIISSLPLERNLRPVRTPYLVFILIAVNLLVFISQATSDHDSFFQQWAYIPGVTALFPWIINSMFIHSGFVHILGNMYFLWIMGDNVEDLMGRGYFLLIYLSAGVLGFVVSGLSGPQGIPHVGASGAVAGIMAAYFLLFPKARFLLRFFIVIVIPISAIWYILFWFGMNLLNYFVFEQLGVAWSAHIVGFLCGLAITAYFKAKHGIGGDRAS